MMAKFSATGPQLASDREKLRLLRAERDRDIAALLTPDERLAYDMRTSPSGATVRNRYGDAIETDAEFQKIFALQKAFDDKFSREALSGRVSPEVLKARGDAERQLDNDLRAAVGDDRYAALRRAADSDVRNIDALVARLNMPPATTTQVMSARETFAAESQRINGDAAVPMAQRRTQIQELATRAKSELTRTLGGEAADAYAQSSQWLNLLSSGMAYSTTPPASSGGTLSLGGPGQSVYPVMPAGATGPGGARQVFINATPGDGAGGGDRAVTNSSVQIMSFGTGSGDPAAAAAHGTPPGGTGTRQMFVTPPQSAQLATPTPPR